jgi:hypothetical protein
MMRFAYRRILPAIVTTAIFAVVSGRSQPTAQDDKATVFRADIRLVVLHATVVDKNGRLRMAMTTAV